MLVTLSDSREKGPFFLFTCAGIGRLGAPGAPT